MGLPAPQPGKYPLLGIVLAAILGIVVADFMSAGSMVSFSVFGLAFLVWLAVRRTTALLFFVSFGFYAIHGLQFEENLGRQLAQELGDRAITVHGTGIIDSIPQANASANGRIRSSFQLSDVELDLGRNQKIGSLDLLLTWPNAEVEIGDRLQFEGVLTRVAGPRNPGEFNYAAWLARRQIFNAVSVQVPKKAAVLERGKTRKVQRYANRSKNALVEIITRDLLDAPTEAGVISAMLLGAKDDTADTVQELFQKTGTTHLFSVSGLHVSMLGIIALFAFSVLRIPRRIGLFLIIPTVFAYTLITGWNPASVRAAIMTAVFVFATLLNRPALSMNTLAVACFLLLAFNTNELFSAGFQLSFLVVAAIIVISAPLGRLFKKASRPDPFIPRKLFSPLQKARWFLAGKISDGLALTLAAWAGSLPLTIWYFSLFTPVALLANLIIVPMSLVVLVLGVLSMLSAPLGGWLVIAFNNANWAWVKVLLFGLHVFSSIPLGSLFVGPHWWQFRNEERITVLDLGSGGATVIETGASCWLVDCGSEADYRRVVRGYLQQRGINKVDGVLLTHGDSSHIGGIAQLKADYPMANVYAPEAGRKSLGFRKLTIQPAPKWLTLGASFALDAKTRLHVLWPPSEVDSGRADDHGFFLRLDAGDERLLLTADSGFTSEMNLLSEVRPDDLRASMVISGRNRQDPGSSENFLTAAGARAMVSTAKSFPESEKIPESLVKLCEKLKIRLLRMDQSGAVQIKIQPEGAKIETFLKSP